MRVKLRAVVARFRAPASTAESGRSIGRTPSGSVEILATQHSAWTTLDTTEPGQPVLRPHDAVSWTRTVYAVRGNQLVVTAKDAGTTKTHDDPSIPLLNRFDCLGAVYPPE